MRDTRFPHGRGGLAPGVVAGIALTFCVLAVGAAVLPRFPGDLELARAIQVAVPAGLMPLLRAVALMGEAVITLPLTAGLAVLLWAIQRRGPSLLVLLTLIPDSLNDLVKTLVGRPRPDPGLLVGDLSTVTGLGFPSGHAVHFLVFFGLLAVALPVWLPLPRRARWALRGTCLVLILLAGLGRVALGVHWPSDVLGGYLLGLLYLHSLLILNTHLGMRLPGLSRHRWLPEARTESR